MRRITLALAPPSELAQGAYDDRLVIYSENHVPYTYHIQATVKSNAVGSVLFDVLDELMEDVGGASIVLQNQGMLELVYRATTAADGTSMVADIPEGR